MNVVWPNLALDRMRLDANRSTPFGFWRFSRDYLRAARSVRSAHGEKLPFPLLYLYGLSIELGLKAFLLQRGATLTEMRRLSHGLIGLLAAARKRKLGREVKLSRLQLAAVQALDRTYSSDQLRYIVTGSTATPEVSVLADAADAIVVGVERYCTGSRGHG